MGELDLTDSALVTANERRFHHIDYSITLHLIIFVYRRNSRRLAVGSEAMVFYVPRCLVASG